VSHSREFIPNIPQRPTKSRIGNPKDPSSLLDRFGIQAVHFRKAREIPILIEELPRCTPQEFGKRTIKEDVFSVFVITA
jgi:hypothetical protein